MWSRLYGRSEPAKPKPATVTNATPAFPDHAGHKGGAPPTIATPPTLEQRHVRWKMTSIRCPSVKCSASASPPPSVVPIASERLLEVTSCIVTKGGCEIQDAD
ncbi:hypothetical protein HispidOSU_009550 [Sigmodon hispidus]